MSGPNAPDREEVTCHCCAGKGKIWKVICPDCGGEGYTSKVSMDDQAVNPKEKMCERCDGAGCYFEKIKDGV